MLLSTGQGRTAFSDVRGEPGGQDFDDLVEAREAHRTKNCDIVDRRIPECDVVSDGVVEDEGLLRDVSDLGGDDSRCEVAQVDIVEQHAAAVRVPQSSEQSGECRLATTRRTDDRVGASGDQFESDTVEHRDLGRVGEREILDAHGRSAGSLAFVARAPAVDTVVESVLDVEDAADTAPAGDRSSRVPHEVADESCRDDEQRHQVGDRDELSWLDQTLCRTYGREREDADGPQRRAEVSDRTEGCPGAAEPHDAFAQRHRGGAETGGLFGLAPQRTHGQGSIEALVRHCRELAEVALHALHVLEREPTADGVDRDDEDHHGASHQPQGHVDAEHKTHRPRQ